MPRAVILLALALGACAGTPPLNSFCRWFEPNDLTDPGLYKLNPANKRATIVNADTRDRECKALDADPGAAKRTGGPR